MAVSWKVSGPGYPRWETVFDLRARKKRLSELEEIAGNSDFWDDSEAAREILREQSGIRNSVEGFEKLRSDMEDAACLFELAVAEDDESSMEEARTMLESVEERVRALEFKRILGGPDDLRNAIVSVNAGAGGTEAQDWASMLLRMYLRYAEKKGFVPEVIDAQEGEEAGIKSATVLASGEFAFGYLKAETGVHRLVRISPFDSNRRRHTSFASVFVSPEIDDSIEVSIDEKDLRIDTYRAGGKGGQHVNKTDSAVRVTHLPTGVVVSCQNERSQRQNKESALKVLRARLYELEKMKEREKEAELNSSKKEIGWGSQIRSYVLHPYRLVKDHRTGLETSGVDAVLDGEIDGFIESHLSSLYGSGAE